MYLTIYLILLIASAGKVSEIHCGLISYLNII